MDLHYKVNGKFLIHVIKPPGSPCCVHTAIIYVLLTYYGIKKILAHWLYLSIYITFYGKSATCL